MTDILPHKTEIAAIYAGFAVAAFVLNVPVFNIPAFIALIGIVCFCFARRRETDNAKEQSHYTWMIRSFVLAVFGYLPLLFILSQVFLLPALNYAPLHTGGDFDAFMLANETRIQAVFTVVTLILNLWVFSRIARGIAALLKNAGIDKVTRLY